MPIHARSSNRSCLAMRYSIPLPLKFRISSLYWVNGLSSTSNPICRQEPCFPGGPSIRFVSSPLSIPSPRPLLPLGLSHDVLHLSLLSDIECLLSIPKRHSYYLASQFSRYRTVLQPEGRYALKQISRHFHLQPPLLLPVCTVYILLGV